MVKLIFIKTFFIFSLALLPSFSLAEDFKYFSISFLGKQIGSLKIRDETNGDSKIIHITGEVSSSPLRLFNGKFYYKTIITGINSGSSRILYESSVDATFKDRRIKYWVRDDVLIAVDVFPKKEQTKFTNPKQIDFEFIDPAYSITKLLSSPCKNSFTIYDGRRAIDVLAIKSASILQCRYLYKIRKGPGHLAPFNFKKIEISIFFDQERDLANRSMIVKAGPLKLNLDQVP